jgi:hypothetical protein
MRHAAAINGSETAKFTHIAQRVAVHDREVGVTAYGNNSEVILLPQIPGSHRRDGLNRRHRADCLRQ